MYVIGKRPQVTVSKWTQVTKQKRNKTGSNNSRGGDILGMQVTTKKNIAHCK